jgi:uncharacterized membrane protein
VTPLPCAVFELVVSPLSAGLAPRPAGRGLGARRAAVEFLSLAAYGYALERVAIAVFESHDYGHAWLLAPGGVPVAVAACWSAAILSSLALAHRLGARSPAALAATAALLGIALDLLMEPVAVRSGLWRWTPPGAWLGVPVGNFVGWGVIVGVYAWGAERSAPTGSAASLAARRLALGTAAILALLLVGLVWTRLGAERLFAGPAAGLLPAGALAPLLVVPRLPKAPARAGLAARLARAGRPWALAPILLAFATNAALLGVPALWLLAATVGGVLGRALASK